MSTVSDGLSKTHTMLVCSDIEKLSLCQLFHFSEVKYKVCFKLDRRQRAHWKIHHVWKSQG